MSIFLFKSSKHINTALKLANVDELQIPSGMWQTQLLYNVPQGEGVFAMFASVMSTQSELPAYLQLQLDTRINDQLPISWAKLYALQQGAEHWYRNVTNQFFASQQWENWRNLNIEEANDEQHNQPFAIFALRIKDVDQAFVALDEHTMSQQMTKMLKGEQPISIVRLLFGKQYQKQQKVNIAVAHNLNEQEAKVPTSVGVPLHILSSAPILASIDWNLTAEMETANLSSLGTSVTFNGKATVRLAHIQKMVGK